MRNTSCPSEFRCRLCHFDLHYILVEQPPFPRHLHDVISTTCICGDVDFIGVESLINRPPAIHERKQAVKMLRQALLALSLCLSCVASADEVKNVAVIGQSCVWLALSKSGEPAYAQPKLWLAWAMLLGPPIFRGFSRGR